MTKEEYVRAANAICQDVDARAEAIAEPKNPDEFVASMNALIKVMDDGQAKLAKLTPPAEVKAEVGEKFLGPNARQAAALRTALPKLEAAARAQDQMTAMAAFGEAFQQMGQIATDQSAWAAGFGLTECAS